MGTDWKLISPLKEPILTKIMCINKGVCSTKITIIQLNKAVFLINGKALQTKQRVFLINQEVVIKNICHDFS